MIDWVGRMLVRSVHVGKRQGTNQSNIRDTAFVPPAPMNHVKYLRAGPAEMPFQNCYTANTNHFRMTDFCQVEINNTTGFSNKHRTALSCAENQILENKISGNSILNICTER